jgi:parvulin-like peptidyl-prolyl isomerase
LNSQRDGYPVSAEQITAYFERNRARYESATVKAVLIRFKPGAAAGTGKSDLEDAAKSLIQNAGVERSEEEARKLAEDIVKKARGGEDFATLATRYSEDEETKAAGGDFGEITPNSSYPESIRKAVFALSPGGVSDPVRIATGFYILRLEKKNPRPIDEVRAEIIQAVRQEHLSEVMNTLNSRFTPVVKNNDFFARPGNYIGGPGSVPAPAPPAR